MLSTKYVHLCIFVYCKERITSEYSVVSPVKKWNVLCICSALISNFLHEQSGCTSFSLNLSVGQGRWIHLTLFHIQPIYRRLGAGMVEGFLRHQSRHWLGVAEVSAVRNHIIARLLHVMACEYLVTSLYWRHFLCKYLVTSLNCEVMPLTAEVKFLL